MCFSPQSSKYQRDFLKIYNDKKLKDNISKAQIYLVSNKELISRNYEKLKNIKKNSFHKEINKNNIIGIFFKNKPKLLNKSLLNNSNNKNTTNKNDNSNENKLISSYSFHGNSLSSNNDNSKKIKKNSIFINENFINKNNKHIKSKAIKKNSINNNKTKTKVNKSNSLLNIRNININNNKINKNKFCFDINKVINKKKNNLGITRNNISKNNNKKKIVKLPLSPDISKIKSINLSLTTKQKTRQFSKSPSINSSSSKANNNINLSDKIDIKEITENYLSKNNNYKNKNVIKRFDNNNLIKNKLKKNFFDYINKDISKYKEKKNDSMSLFDKLYDKLTKKFYKEIKPMIFKMKSKRSSSYSNLNILRYDKNYKNKIKKVLLNSNDIATSGSINFSFQEELSSEEIHFKAVKYYQEIKNKDIFE